MYIFPVWMFELLVGPAHVWIWICGRLCGVKVEQGWRMDYEDDPEDDVPDQGAQVEMWMEGDVAHLSVHTYGQPFDVAKEQLTKMRDRLAIEISRGPECPFSPEGRQDG